MIETIPLMIALVGTPPPAPMARLTLKANATEILQRDNLLVSIVVDNLSDVELQLEPSFEASHSYFRLEVDSDSGWQLRRTMHDEVDPIDFGGSGPLTVPPQSEFTEFNWHHLHENRHIFAAVGTYKLRATAKTSAGELVSNTVEVKVGDRSNHDQERIREARTAIYRLETTLKWDTSEILNGLQDVGGNIQTTIRNRNLVREYLRSATIDGKAVLPTQLCETLQKRLDEVSYNAALDHLAWYYIAERDGDGLARVLNALPCRSDGYIAGAAQLKDFLKSPKPIE
jgi:hypothetical protein